ncbi:MAG: response regulator, partial [Lysobacteraceae bacterium]
IMLTGFADLKNAIESKKLGAEDFVSKPYDLVDLLTTVERVLSGV